MNPRARIEFGPKDTSPGGWIQSIELRREKIGYFAFYPFSVPAVKRMDVLKLPSEIGRRSARI